MEAKCALQVRNICNMWDLSVFKKIICSSKLFYDLSIKLLSYYSTAMTVFLSLRATRLECDLTTYIFAATRHVSPTSFISFLQQWIVMYAEIMLLILLQHTMIISIRYVNSICLFLTNEHFPFIVTLILE